ncbi:MAG: DoxX family protein [Saprospiraceae bacterium]
MSTQTTSKGLHIGLWVLQVLLGLMFIMAGAMKASMPIEALAESLPWVTETPAALVKFIGISELLGGLGLILPSALRIKPNLTVLAAIGLAIVMVLAAGFHASRGEFPAIGMNVVMLALFAFVAWGRSKKAVIQPK